MSYNTINIIAIQATNALAKSVLIVKMTKFTLMRSIVIY